MKENINENEFIEMTDFINDSDDNNNTNSNNNDHNGETVKDRKEEMKIVNKPTAQLRQMTQTRR